MGWCGTFVWLLLFSSTLLADATLEEFTEKKVFKFVNSSQNLDISDACKLSLSRVSKLFKKLGQIQISTRKKFI